MTVRDRWYTTPDTAIVVTFWKSMLLGSWLSTSEPAVLSGSKIEYEIDMSGSFHGSIGWSGLTSTLCSATDAMP